MHPPSDQQSHEPRRDEPQREGIRGRRRPVPAPSPRTAWRRRRFPVLRAAGRVDATTDSVQPRPRFRVSVARDAPSRRGRGRNTDRVVEQSLDRDARCPSPAARRSAAAAASAGANAAPSAARWAAPRASSAAASAAAAAEASAAASGSDERLGRERAKRCHALREQAVADDDARASSASTLRAGPRTPRARRARAMVEQRAFAHATSMPDSSSSVAASRARTAMLRPPRARRGDAWIALSAALVRGNASHASALQTSCRLSGRVSTISPRPRCGVSYASADKRRGGGATNASGRPSGSASAASRAQAFSVAMSGQSARLRGTVASQRA